MSIRVMTAVWDLPLPPSEKLVLLALADWAQDDGRCWPSIAKVAQKSGVSERTVQRMLREAEKAGLLTRTENVGKGCEYRLTPRHSVTPDKMAPVTNGADTPDTVSPNTLGTVSRGSEAKASSPKRPMKFILPADIPAEPFEAFAEMRAKAGKKMTDYAKHLAVLKLRKLRDEDGWPPGDVLNHSTLSSYQGLFPPKDQRNGSQPQPSLRGTRPSPALELLKSAERQERAEREAQGNHCQPRIALPAQRSF